MCKKYITMSAVLAMSLSAQSPLPETIVGYNEGIVLAVDFSKSYAKSSKIILKYTIRNTTNREWICYKSDPMFDMSIKLTDPFGKQVIHYQEQDGVVNLRHRSGLLSTRILKHSEEYSGEVDLAFEYPISSTGEYRCVLTRKVYPAEFPIKAYPPGDGLNVTTPEFRFRVESIDPEFKSPLSQLLILKNGVLFKNGVPIDKSAAKTISDERSNTSEDRDPRIDPADKFENSPGSSDTANGSHPASNSSIYWWIVGALLATISFYVFYIIRHKK